MPPRKNRQDRKQRRIHKKVVEGLKDPSDINQFQNGIRVGDFRGPSSSTVQTPDTAQNMRSPPSSHLQSNNTQIVDVQQHNDGQARGFLNAQALQPDRHQARPESEAFTGPSRLARGQGISPASSPPRHGQYTRLRRRRGRHRTDSLPARAPDADHAFPMGIFLVSTSTSSEPMINQQYPVNSEEGGHRRDFQSDRFNPNTRSPYHSWAPYSQSDDHLRVGEDTPSPLSRTASSADYSPATGQMPWQAGPPAASAAFTAPEVYGNNSASTGEFPYQRGYAPNIRHNLSYPTSGFVTAGGQSTVQAPVFPSPQPYYMGNVLNSFAPSSEFNSNPTDYGGTGYGPQTSDASDPTGHPYTDSSYYFQ